MEIHENLKKYLAFKKHTFNLYFDYVDLYNDRFDHHNRMSYKTITFHNPMEHKSLSYDSTDGDIYKAATEYMTKFQNIQRELETIESKKHMDYLNWKIDSSGIDADKHRQLKEEQLEIEKEIGKLRDKSRAITEQLIPDNEAMVLFSNMNPFDANTIKTELFNKYGSEQAKKLDGLNTLYDEMALYESNYEQLQIDNKIKAIEEQMKKASSLVKKAMKKSTKFKRLKNGKLTAASKKKLKTRNLILDEIKKNGKLSFNIERHRLLTKYLFLFEVIQYSTMYSLIEDISYIMYEQDQDVLRIIPKLSKSERDGIKDLITKNELVPLTAKIMRKTLDLISLDISDTIDIFEYTFDRDSIAYIIKESEMPVINIYGHPNQSKLIVFETATEVIIIPSNKK